MKTFLKRQLQCLPMLAALTGTSLLWAQSAPATEASPPPAASVGDATHSLLQRQREGREASTAPRPIDGRVAELSHQRYLKSFEQPVPAWFDSRLEQGK